MAPSSSSSPSSISPHPPTTSHFTPIQEEDGNESTSTTTPNNKANPKHTSTPLHHYKQGKRHGKKRSEISAGSSSANREDEDELDDLSVNCNKCRPNGREKISVVPLDNNNGFNRKNASSSSSISMASPNGILKSILSSFTRNKQSPKLPMDPYAAAAREEKWKVAVAELSQKLIQTTRRRDEAVLEASGLKYSMTELEKKLNKLEIYCHGLKSGLEECTTGNNSPYSHHNNKRHIFSGFNDSNKAVVDHFLVAVSESRTGVRQLSRSLIMQLRHMAGTKVYDKITALLQPYDIKLSLPKNPRSLVYFLEALLSKTFFDEFESPGFNKNSGNLILNPVERCEVNYTSFSVLRGLTWDEVLIKGTRHFSGDFSRFCDKKMSEIVAMLGWNRAWPEPLLQAFFGACKSVWLVHLLATSVHPSLPVFRVESGFGFDPVYMEDMGGDKARKLVPSVVRIMVAPGFYVFGTTVVKCKVLCRYNSSSDNKGLAQSTP